MPVACHESIAPLGQALYPGPSEHVPQCWPRLPGGTQDRGDCVAPDVDPARRINHVELLQTGLTIQTPGGQVGTLGHHRAESNLHHAAGCDPHAHGAEAAVGVVEDQSG